MLVLWRLSSILIIMWIVVMFLMVKRLVVAFIGQRVDGLFTQKEIHLRDLNSVLMLSITDDCSLAQRRMIVVLRYEYFF